MRSTSKPALRRMARAALLRDQAGFRFNLRRSDFHFQPFLKLVLIGPDFAHLRASIPSNHFGLSKWDFGSKWEMVTQDRIRDSGFSIQASPSRRL